MKLTLVRFCGFLLFAPTLLARLWVEGEATGIFSPTLTKYTPKLPLDGRATTCTVPGAQNTSGIAWGEIKSMYNLNRNYAWFMKRELHTPGQACGSNPNYGLRKNWRWAEASERAAYIKAMKCMHQVLPNKDRTVPGSRFRIDDFVAAHMRQGYNVEFTGLHLHWHRIFLHLYEQALRNECGYKGSLMYWDFSDFAVKTKGDPMFSGSGNGTSIGGNGDKTEPHGAVTVDFSGKAHEVGSGDGGGCLSDPVLGSFRARLGKPLTYNPDPAVVNDYPLPEYTNGTIDPDCLQPTERCLTRDLNEGYARLLDHCHVEYDLDCADFACLQDRLYGESPGYAFPASLMSAARLAIGGLQLDPYAGPADPIWWLVATNFDRLWALWQGQQEPLEGRKMQVAGTHSPYNGTDSSGTPGISADDILEFAGLAGSTSYRVADAGSTIEGPLCYLYDGTY